ncbi:tRNA-specific adenosine deaminase [Kineosphaera limosa NBRC 100340]|uniref:tRNA-specific adenosine deaminase n=2 Tax=Kineosphaera TaxID=211469 RepID=K6X1B3_9MICO|nr:tRNA-specific adenosine deaminase [Kineosphaera limosa NBRC 100340]
MPPAGEERADVRVEPGLESVMERLLADAARAGRAGEVPVAAAVLGPEGNVLGWGVNRRERDGDPTAHAEVLALRAAAAQRGAADVREAAASATEAPAQGRGRWRLDETTLLVTLEPCAMCAGAALQARVGRIVFGAWDDKAGACGSVWDLPRDRFASHRAEVVGGLREGDSAALLREFFAARRPRPSG